MTTSNAYPTDQIIRTIGILGGGQLGMMLAEAALPLGYRCIFLEDAPNCPASLYGKVYSSQQLDDFIKHADVFTLEFENIPVKTCAWLAKLSDPEADVPISRNEFDGAKHGMYPPPAALAVTQDRLAEKNLFKELGIATVPFLSVSHLDELIQAVATLGLPLVLKTSRGGYDGKGQYVLKTAENVDKAWQALGAAVTGDGDLTPTPAPLIAEGFIDFSREVSIIAARGQDGAIRCYDLVENQHYHNILATTRAPAVGASHLYAAAKQAVSTLMTHLDYVGVMALELFVSKDETGNDVILANEIAPRVHNSGHFSIEGAVTSQFENHIRAVVGLPLGDTDNVLPSVMVNILGQYPKPAEVLAIEGAHYHSYHKLERPERKIGHVTLMPTDVAKLDDAVTQLLTALPNNFTD